MLTPGYARTRRTGPRNQETRLFELERVYAAAIAQAEEIARIVVES